MNKDELNLVQSLKIDKERVHRFEEGLDEYGILILGRGESLFFQKNEKALICHISAIHAELDASTIKKWDNKKSLSPAEKTKTVDEIAKFYKKAYKDDLKVS